MAELVPITRKENFLARAAGNDGIELEPITREEHFLQKIIDSAGGGSATEKTLDQRGFITRASTINVMQGTGPDYYFSISSSYGQDYVPEAGSLLIVCAPASGIASNATLKFKVGSNKYTQSWPINISSGPIYGGYVNASEIVLLSFNGSRFYVASVVRDPVPTNLSEFENDLDMSAYQEIVPVTLGTEGEAKFAAMLNYAKAAITASSGEKSVMFPGNFNALVLTVYNLVQQNKLPVVQLNNFNRIVVTEVGGINVDAEDAVAWYAGSYHESANVDGTLYAFSHEISVATGAAMIHTKKYPLEVVTS